MTEQYEPFLRFLPPLLRTQVWRGHPMDGKLLLFDRDTGLNVLLEGEETQDFRRQAPRTLLVAVTNACNLTCAFCYRDLESRSLWRYDSLLAFCREIDEWGVLEVAFGGGEPMIFPRWAELIGEIYDTTRLCVNFTTNGTEISERFLAAIAGKYGNIRVSLYEDNNWPRSIALLAASQARFGVNWLITPDSFATLDAQFDHLLALGARDFLFLSYKGHDSRLHLRGQDLQGLSDFVNRVHREHGPAVQIKLDICWGNRLAQVPRLFTTPDCGAGDNFLSITSDKHVKLCSFAGTETGLHFETVDDLRAIWQRQRALRQAALIPGCARLPNAGLTEGGPHAFVDLAAIQ